MNTLRWPLILCLAVSLLSPGQAQAKKHKQPTPAPLATPSAEPPPLPAEVTPNINPELPPSVSLQPFLDTHLGEILTPLGVSAFAQPELIASMKASYADGLAAAPASHAMAYRLAEAVCDAMTSAMTERQNAVAALRGALATRSSEADQPRGGGEAVNAARDRDDFFIESAKNTWIQRATVLSHSITALYLRERTVERQVGPWTPPPPAPNPVPGTSPAPAASPAPGTSPAPATSPVQAGPTSTANVSAPVSPSSAASGVAAVTGAATPSVSSTPVPSLPEPSYGSDPVIGQWLLDGRAELALGADHSISGSRSGTWCYTGTTAGGRNYELHWKPPKNWVDYLVLAADCRTMIGKTRKNDPISYYRP
jgi:hypothetical protein